MEQTHSQHLIKLQHSLREEIDGRQTAERALTELRGEVSIGIEDTSPVMQTQGIRDNFGLFSLCLLLVFNGGNICIIRSVCVAMNMSGCVLQECTQVYVLTCIH